MDVNEIDVFLHDFVEQIHHDELIFSKYNKKKQVHLRYDLVSKLTYISIEFSWEK